MTQTSDGKRDLVLAPGEYAYLQDETRGMVKTYVGPTVINQTAQDRPVFFDNSSFNRCTLEQAVKRSPFASEGDYIVLENPASDGVHPDEGSASRPMPTLKVGRKVNIPGPTTFALWPGQKATTIKGHHLRSNQYLMVRVYNEQEAKTNWASAVVRTTDSAESLATTKAESLTIGKMLIIKGTEVSFYIPPTGVEVLVENNNYIREAVTLERLEYAILIDESGNKRYEHGPQVVFPLPTETIFTDGRGKKKFKALELNTIQGLHIKVIAEYAEGDKQYKIGDELFITGADMPIYYPRVEHSIIRYGDKNKHYSTAIPAGEGRYVMDRNTGEIKTECGPKMLLPDPRKEVIVRRILSDKQVQLWYPNNTEALEYNRKLRQLAIQAASGRSGFVSENDYRSQGDVSNVGENLDYSDDDSPVASSLEVYGAALKTKQLAGSESFQRGTNYTQPRTVTLDTKFEGVPSVTVWTGYAVLVVSKTGKRRVVTGPTTILLGYDESLEVLELSTGKPKNTDQLEKTVYLRIANNKVSDVVQVRTKDHVEVNLKLSYRVNFENEPEKWFSVENYVKFLCDHVRSVLKGTAQKRTVEDFYTEGVDIIRDALLGPAVSVTEVIKNALGIEADVARVGMVFHENGMHLTDVEVLGINVDDKDINTLLSDAQHEVVQSNITLHQAIKQLEVVKEQQKIEREKAQAEAETQQLKNTLQIQLINQQLNVSLEKIASDLKQTSEQEKVETAKEKIKDITAQSDLARKKSIADQEAAVEQTKQKLKAELIVAETTAAVQRFGAAQDGFSEALLSLQSQDTLTKVAEALSVQKLIGGQNIVDAISKIFQGSPVEGLLNKVMERSIPVLNKK